MKNLIKIATLTLAVIFFLAVILSAQEHNHDHKTEKKAESKTESHQMMDAKMMDKNNDGKVFQCSMCSDQISDKSSDCQKCGMKLSEVSVDDANKNIINNHGKMMKHDKKMTCGEDGKMSCCGDKEMKDHAVMEANIVHKGAIEVAKIDMNKDGKVYQDMMDWNVISDTPGDCPLCGMKLKEVTLDQAEKNLEKNGFKTK